MSIIKVDYGEVSGITPTLIYGTDNCYKVEKSYICTNAFFVVGRGRTSSSLIFGNVTDGVLTYQSDATVVTKCTYENGILTLRENYSSDDGKVFIMYY